MFGDVSGNVFRFITIFFSFFLVGIIFFYSFAA